MASTKPPDPTAASHLPHRSSAYAGRRPPAHRSVSLLHSSSQLNKPATPSEKSAQASTVPNSDDAQPSSTSPSDRPKHNQHSSGESSDAGNWFANSNNNIRESNTLTSDNDPPFFLRNASSSSTPPDQITANPYQNAPFLTYAQRTALPGIPNDGSSGDDYRSVIDDLTIANKRLKRRLRKYEKMHDAHLQDEKLFEVRFHGLPDHKKRELEETLRKFAMNIDNTPLDPSAGLTGAVPGLDDQRNYAPLLHAQKTNASSHTSRFAESGYASMSMSGQDNSSVPSGKETTPKDLARPNFSKQNAEIRSYLHDIPVGLLPRGNTMAMSEKSRKKLVVRRLEQIFAGKGAGLDRHQQPIQQQEVSRSAAQADRRAKEAIGQPWRKEGVRIAKIMPHSNDNDTEMDQPPEQNHSAQSLYRVVESETMGNNSPDQRPTRPLDLDPHREQVPADNIEYIRHLGFTPPDMEHSPEEGHGWVYLNLLINMAQLHTVNVTLDFVQKAVNDCSSHLELSNDGRKVRWRGGSKLTRHNSDSSSDYDGECSPDSSLEDGTGTGTDKVNSTSEKSKSRKRSRHTAQLNEMKPSNKHAYTPLFTHREDSNDDNYLTPTEPSTLSPPAAGQESSAFASSGMLSNPSKRRRDNGPMIFYNKAHFCTDLTGDQNRSEDHSTYQTMTQKPIGDVAERASISGSLSERRDPAGPFDHAGDVEMQDEISDKSSPSDLNFSLKSLEDNLSVQGKQSVPYNFEASGLGGVQPDDNFAIHVVSRQTRYNKDASGKTASTFPTDGTRVPQKIRSILSGHKHSNRTDQTVSDKIVSATTQSFPASALPPASYLTLHSSSGDADSDDDDSEAESDFSMTSTQHQPTVRRQPVAGGPYDYGMSDEEESSEEEDDEDDEDESGSVDLLATARQVDPEAIRIREREYESNVAERLAEDIPAGSSAATAGGGSGFNSPADADPRKLARN